MRELLSDFPETDLAIAYGSAVFKQAGYSKDEQPMLDLIFAVADPLAWHAANLARNPSHYSLLARALGAGGVCALQERAAHIYYNATWPRLKYGVISLRRLHDDLTQWDTLYVAGRMHKPVRCLHARLASASSPSALPSAGDGSSSDRLTSVAHIVSAARSNLRAAFCAALLTLPAAFTDRELFAAIAALSYAGDVRFRLGLENPNKVANLVAPHVAAFRALYYPFIARHLRVSPTSSHASLSLSPSLVSPVSHAFARFPRSAHFMPAASSAHARWSNSLCSSPLVHDDTDPPSTMEHHAIDGDAQTLPAPLQRAIAAANGGTAALFPWSLSPLLARLNSHQPNIISPGVGDPFAEIPPNSSAAGQVDAPWYLQQDMSVGARHSLFASLPPSLQRTIVSGVSGVGSTLSPLSTADDLSAASRVAVSRLDCNATATAASAARPAPPPAATCGVAHQSHASHIDTGTGSSTATSTSTSTGTGSGIASGIVSGTGIAAGSGAGWNSGMRAGVLRAIGGIVGASSFWQSAKGSLTSRPSTSVRYMWRKFQKAVARK